VLLTERHLGIIGVCKDFLHVGNDDSLRSGLQRIGKGSGVSMRGTNQFPAKRPGSAPEYAHAGLGAPAARRSREKLLGRTLNGDRPVIVTLRIRHTDAGEFDVPGESTGGASNCIPSKSCFTTGRAWPSRSALASVLLTIT
jgi:hypothetical protein